jgi:hypothetical protein
MQKSAATPALVAPERPPGALVVKSDQGRTWFSVNARKGEFAPNQGFYEFDVRLK